jgi:uracil-DNA glycosylase family 4
LKDYLSFHVKAHPEWHNAPVDAMGSVNARILIVGLAPGLKGANATGRPFTGDSAGGYLFEMLSRFGMAHGSYGGHAGDGVTLDDVRITNAVRCVPPQNKPTAAESHNCRPFLVSEIMAMPNIKVILALGRLAHDAVLRATGYRCADYPFAHASQHRISSKATCGKDRDLRLISSYHCSRYNTQTRRLTDDMFYNVFKIINNETNLKS